jgi:hypothetical protein
MFSSLARRISPRLIDGLDLVVELSTLGEYGVDGDGVFALGAVDEHGAPACERDDNTPAAGREDDALPGEREHGTHARDPEHGIPACDRLRPAAPRLRERCPVRGAVSQPCRDASARP